MHSYIYSSIHPSIHPSTRTCIHIHSKREVDVFAERLDKTLREFRKKIAAAQSKAQSKAGGAEGEAQAPPQPPAHGAQGGLPDEAR